MLAGVTDFRGSQKWGCRGRLGQGFKPRCSSHRDRGPRGSEGEETGPWGIECFFLPHGLGSRRDFAKKKREERTLAGGP